MFKRLLVPLDGSRFGSRALKYATDVAQRFDAEIILMQVIKPATPVPSTTGMPPSIESPAAAKISAQAALQEDKSNAARARRYLSRKLRAMRPHGIKGSYHVVIGDPVQSIMRFSKKAHIDLIVMSTHGKSGLKRAILGSVADEVIRESGKPVLVVRPGSRRKKQTGKKEQVEK
jgi:nucleotide-binding universal stress UspA family protein